MTTMKRISSVFAVMAIIVCCSCGGGTKPNPENRTYENAYKSSSTVTATETDNPYLENKLQTGAISYNNNTCEGDESKISVATETDNPYLENKLQTGAIPYNNNTCEGDESKISVLTSASSECDVIVIVKRNNQIVRNVYIEAGDSYDFSVPNGTYQVFFYSGKGWNPHKKMTGGYVGGFVANESYSKDSSVALNYQDVSYELIPQQNGNFSTMQSNASEIF